MDFTLYKSVKIIINLSGKDDATKNFTRNIKNIIKTQISDLTT